MFKSVPTSIAQRVADLEDSILSARRLAWNASQIGDAAAFGRVDRILTELYAERDGLVKLHPEEAQLGRVLTARRRAEVPAAARTTRRLVSNGRGARVTRRLVTPEQRKAYLAEEVDG